MQSDQTEITSTLFCSLGKVGMDTGASGRASSELAHLHGKAFPGILIGPALTWISFIETAFTGFSFGSGNTVCSCKDLPQDLKEYFVFLEPEQNC